MRIVFIGAVQFSKSTLIKLIEMDTNIVGVCTLKNSSFNADHVDLTELCDKNNIPSKYSQDINTQSNVEWVKKLSPDVIFCFGWSRLLKSDILNIAPLGVIGYHPTDLPKNRGRHPLIWALALGLNETASTFFFMDEGADSGSILSKKKIEISETDNATSLYSYIIKIALVQLEEFVPALTSGNYKIIPQDNSKANYWRKRNIRDGKIDWRMDAVSIHNLVRALAKPYNGAHFEFEGQDIKVWQTQIIKNNIQNVEPGKVMSVKKDVIIIKTGYDTIKLIYIEPNINVIKGFYL